MGVVYFNGSVEDEQARGGDIDAGSMQSYAIRRDRPSEMIYLGGHFMDDAPSYNITEGKILPVYKHVNGRNIVEERQITEDIIKSVTFNLMLPHKALSVTDRLYQSQKSCSYDVVFVPDDCSNDCDTFFYLARDVKFGTKQLTSTILGYDDNANPITNMRTLRATGNLVTYYGLNGSVSPAPADLLSATIVSTRCEGCDCPYQNMVVGGNTYLGRLDNGIYTVYNTIAADSLMTLPGTDQYSGVVYSGGNIVVAFTDSITAPTEGGIGYLNYETGTALAVSTLDGATSFVDTTAAFTGVVEAFGKVFAFGLGIIAVSCDGGISFTTVADATTLGTNLLNKAVYDSGSGNLIFAAANRVLVTYNNSTVSIFTDAALFPASVGATEDFVSIAVGAPGHVYLGTNGGKVLEISDFSELSATNPFTIVSADAGATSITFIGADKNNVRVVWNEAGNDVIKSRDVINKMIPYVLYDHGETINGGVTGAELLDEGTNFYFMVGDDVTLTLAACGLCVSSGC